MVMHGEDRCLGLGLAYAGGVMVMHGEERCLGLGLAHAGGVMVMHGEDRCLGLGLELAFVYAAITLGLTIQFQASSQYILPNPVQIGSGSEVLSEACCKQG